MPVFFDASKWAAILTTLVLVECAVLAVNHFRRPLTMLLLPLTLNISLWLKQRIENVDFFDSETDFNPLRF